MTAEPAEPRPTPVVPAAAHPPGAGVPWPAARRIAWEAPEPLTPCTVPLSAAGGLRLAEPLVATVQLPPASVSAMDGWAVSGEPPWRVVGDVRAGGLPSEGIAAGAAVRIATGAVVPAGTEAVVRDEDARALPGGLVTLRGPAVTPAPGSHVRPAGEEARSGDLLLAAGSLLTPPALGLAAASGRDALLVHRRPRVAALVLGDELAAAGPPAPGRIRDALGPQLPGWLHALGAEALGTTRLRDDPDALVGELSALLAARRRGPAEAAPDVVVTTGGSAHGPADHVRSAVRRLGGDFLVAEVAVRPGHPMALGRLGDGPWLVALPGNPFAALAGLLTLLAPLLAALRSEPTPASVSVTVARSQPGEGRRHRLVPVRTSGRTADPVDHSGPAMLRGIAGADGALVVPPDGLSAGSVARYLPLPWTRC